MGPTGPIGTADPAQVILNGTTPQVASFSVTGSGAVGESLTAGGAISTPATWGITARTQGLVIAPEGTVSDDGATLTFGATVIVMNPAAGSYVRIAAGSYALGASQYLYVDLPPKATRGSVLTPSVASYADGDRPYDGPDRLVLAHRLAGGTLLTRFQGRIDAAAAPSSLVSFVTSLTDQRNSSAITAPGTWWTVPGRVLTFTKRFATSRLKVTYQDTLGASATTYDACEWQILLDGTQIAFFTGPDLDTSGLSSTPAWRIQNAAHLAWATAAAGNHNVLVQNRGAWSSTVTECLAGWNTNGTSFLSVEEIP